MFLTSFYYFLAHSYANKTFFVGRNEC